MIIKQKNSESSHWYTKKGESAYQVQGKTGLRATTLRDARKLDLVPSVTTILGVVAKPALTTWLQTQVLLSALTLPRQPDEPEKDWLERVMADSKVQGNEAAKRGLAREEEIGKKYAEQVGLDKLKEAYEKKGLTGAGGELLRQIPLAVTEQAPNIASALGGARLGAMAGSAFGPVGTVVGGGLGALGASFLPQAGQFIRMPALRMIVPLAFISAIRRTSAAVRIRRM